MALATRSLPLPAQPTPLVDREDELATICQRMVGGDTRLLTLTGPAGVGKTRLALAAATQLAEVPDRFPDGVAFVDLTSLREPQLVLSSVAAAVGLLDMGSRPVLERLREALGERRLLAVLDNCEQVLPAAPALADLLAACPGLALLATSRVPLRLRWERALRIAPLPVPDLSAPLPPLGELAAIPSVALFVQRARAHQPDFVLGERQAPVVARLVAQLDGLPLALELAAARAATLALPTLTRRLGDRLRLLRWEAADAPARQRSLEAAVGWSYDLLGEPERRLFRCLGVFVGRVSLDAIAAVVAAVAGAGDEAGAADGGERGGDGGRTLDRLASLAEQSLVLPVRPADLGWQQAGQGATANADDDAEDEEAEPAFGMLETVREYARERLVAAGELAAAHRAHAAYFLALAERADPQLRGRDQRAWLFRLEREHDNLRAALRCLLDQEDLGERVAALRLAGALGWFWAVRGYHVEGGRWLEEALARAAGEGEGEEGEEADAASRTRALRFAGMLFMLQGDVARARAHSEEALVLAERRHDPATAAEALADLGLRAVLAGEVEEGTWRLREALRRWETLGEAHPHGLGRTLFHLGFAADATGDAAAAAARYAAALQQVAAAGDAQFAGLVRCYLGEVAGRRGELARAVEEVRAELQTSVALRDRWLLSIGVQAATALVGTRAAPAARGRLLGAAEALAQATGAERALWEPGHVADPGAPGLRAHLTEAPWAAAYQEGRALPFGEVAALALRLLEEVATATAPPGADAAAVGPAPSPQPAAPSLHNPLSAREREVLRLVAQGLSNKAIGRALFLSASTVNFHLTAAFHKLGVNTRAQAVAEAARRGLV